MALEESICAVQSARIMTGVLETLIVRQVLNLHAMNGSDSEFYGCLQKRELWVEVDWWNKIQAGCL